MKIATSWREEPWRLEIFDIQDDDDTPIAKAPLVNGWLQISLEITHVPSLEAQHVFLAAVRQVVAALRQRGCLDAWFFVHKEPGLRLRFKMAGDLGEAIAGVVAALATWDWDWLGSIAFDSYFEQRELLSAYFESDVNALLTLSADCYVESALTGACGNLDAWAAFTLAFLRHFAPDEWLVWEALGRFIRLRGAPWREASAASRIDFSSCPKTLQQRLSAMLPIAQPGFDASTTLLQCLNYIYNQWALNLTAQQMILAEARRRTEPEITQPLRLDSHDPICG